MPPYRHAHRRRSTGLQGISGALFAVLSAITLLTAALVAGGLLAHPFA